MLGESLQHRGFIGHVKSAEKEVKADEIIKPANKTMVDRK